MGVTLFERLLEEEWIEDADKVEGRIHDVPKPAYITREAPDRRRFNLKQGDAIFIHDEGEPVIEPKSLGWVEERVEEHITIDCYSGHSFERIEGYRNDNNVAEAYGGMQGEVKRILDMVRGGYKEFYLIQPTAWIDLHENEPGGIWRGQWDVTLVEYDSIQQDMDRDLV